jgi:hypothetical protein
MKQHRLCSLRISLLVEHQQSPQDRAHARFAAVLASSFAMAICATTAGLRRHGVAHLIGGIDDLR